MKYVVYAVLLFVALVLQTTLMPALNIFGVSADIISGLLVALSVSQGPLACAAMGGVTGLVLDMLFMRPGFFIAQYLLLGFAGSFAARHVKIGRTFVLVVLCFVLFSGKELIQLLYLYLSRVEINFSVAIVKLLLGGALTAAVMLPIYGFVGALNRLPFMQTDGAAG